MVETFTPAGCGGRTRRITALILFGISATATSAALGAGLGLIGMPLPARWALGFAAALALLAALAEADILRIRLPQRRRQVPERWRRELPLPAWSAGYGAILGSGFGTFQPAASFWVGCAGALALGDPASAAICLAAFGAGRAVMLVAPRNPLGSLARLHRLVRPVNAVVLAAVVAALVPSAARGAVGPPPPPSGQGDPSVSNGVIAYTDQLNGVQNVVVLEPGGQATVFPDGRLPALSTRGLAYVTSGGIRVVLWRTGQEVLRVPGRVDEPALAGQRLAYTERIGALTRLVLGDVTTGRVRVIASVGAGVDLGRPALSGRFIAWHEARGQSNVIFLRDLDTGRTRIVASGGRSVIEANPALGAGHIAWIEAAAERSSVLVRAIGGGPVRRVASTLGPRFHFWHTAIDARRVYVTRWSLGGARASILHYRW